MNSSDFSRRSTQPSSRTRPRRRGLARQQQVGGRESGIFESLEEDGQSLLSMHSAHPEQDRSLQGQSPLGPYLHRRPRAGKHDVRRRRQDEDSLRLDPPAQKVLRLGIGGGDHAIRAPERSSRVGGVDEPFGPDAAESRRYAAFRHDEVGTAAAARRHFRDHPQEVPGARHLDDLGSGNLSGDVPEALPRQALPAKPQGRVQEPHAHPLPHHLSGRETVAPHAW